MSFLGIVKSIKIKESKAKSLRNKAALIDSSIVDDLEMIAASIDIEKDCKPLKPKDVTVGQIVIGKGDYGLYCHIIDEVHRPSDPWKAYTASDGCIYGIEDAYLIFI